MVAMATPWRHPKTGVYYLRKSVPEDVRNIIGKREIKVSLGTKNPKEAKQLFLTELSVAESLINNARSGQVYVSSKQASAYAGVWLKKALDEDEVNREQGMLPLDEREENDSPYDLTLDHIADAASEGKGYAFVRNDIKGTLESYGIAVADDYIQGHEELIARFLEAKHKFYRVLQERASGQWRKIDLDYPSLPDRPRTPPKVIKGTTFETLWDAWEQETTTVQKTRDEYQKVLSEFEKVNGRVAIEAISKDHIRAYKTKLVESKKLKPSSMNKKLSALKSLLGYAEANGYIDSNPAHGFKVTENVSKIDSRHLFSSHELKGLFSTPIYTEGYRPAAGKGETAYWFPLLALYTGARREELGVLSCSSVREFEGVHYIEILGARKGNQKVKRSMERIVPIHSDLIKLGFLDYVGSVQKNTETPLFPDLSKANKYGQLTTNWSKWWVRYHRSLGIISGSKKVFHSFRHTFVQACREANIPSEQRMALVGHNKKDVSFTYGGWTSPSGVVYPFSPESLSQEILKLKIILPIIQ